MKKVISVLLACIFIASALSACSIFPPFGRVQRSTEPIETSGVDVPAVDVPTAAVPTAAPTEMPTEPVIETLESYVKTAKEATFTFDSGSTNTFRLPEILLDSADADAANTEIMLRFGDDCVGGRGSSSVITMDYEAYLSDRFLSVVVITKYEGGNSYGLCYAFDVTTGNELSGKNLCSVTGRDYNNVIGVLTANVTAEYDERYAQLPGNDAERDKTLAYDNISAAKLYLDDSGKIKALVNLYAAVGGGHWIDTFAAE